MNHDTQLELIDRVHAHLERKSTDTGDGVATQPVASYTCPDRLALETKALFRDRPLIVGHVSELTSPGDYITHDASGVAILVIRGDDGEPRAFINQCRHRGMRVVAGERGNSASLTCPYHGWCYRRDGDLAGVPHRHGFNGALDGRALFQLPLALRHGFVFVTPDPGADPLDEDAAATLFGDLDDDLRHFALADSHVYAPRSVTRALNWKLVFDVFLEAYHLRLTHANTIFPMFFDNIGLVDAFEPHLRNVFPKRTITSLLGTDRGEWSLRQHANILYFIFPNTIILVEPDHAAALHVFPDGVDRARILSYTLVPQRPTEESARGYWDANNAVLYAATDEDLAMGEAIAAGLATGGNRVLTFGAFEHALAHFHSWVTAAVASPHAT